MGQVSSDLQRGVGARQKVKRERDKQIESKETEGTRDRGVITGRGYVVVGALVTVRNISCARQGSSLKQEILESVREAAPCNLLYFIPS